MLGFPQSCLIDCLTHLSALMNVVKVTLLSFKAESEYTFVDFIRGGYVVVPPVFCYESETASWDNVKCVNAEGQFHPDGVCLPFPSRMQLNFTVAIDFTASNGRTAFHCSVGAAALTKCLNDFCHLLLLKSITYCMYAHL